MNLLALDIGTRRTGVAFADTNHDFIMALDTIEHSSVDELLSALSVVIHNKKIDELIVGLPRLLDGSEGEQARFVRSVVQVIKKEHTQPITIVDERYSSHDAPKTSADSKAACSILEVAVSQRKNRH